MRRYLFLVCSVLIISGCQAKLKEQEEPFLFDYKENTIVPENKEKVDEWLTNAKLNEKSKIHSLEMDNGYTYLYANGYSDVLVTYQRDLRNGKQDRFLRVNFKKGNENDEVFIEVQYNPKFCCDSLVIDDSFKGE